MDLSNQNLLSASLLRFFSLVLFWFILGAKWMAFILTSATLLTLLHCKLNDCRQSAGYVNWYHSHLTSVMLHVPYCGILSLLYAMGIQPAAHVPHAAHGHVCKLY
jgi:hypothetical protein